MSNESLNDFLLLKKLPVNLNLNEDVLNLIQELFGSNIKQKIIKKNNNLLKNTKIQQKKDTISNKVNLILNKLSENNIHNLVLEFIDIINIFNINDFEEFQKTFYKKILNEIKFINIYLKFLKIIGYIYYEVYNYTLEFLVNLIELKFKKDYAIIENINDPKFECISNLNDDIFRINNLTLIKDMVNNKLLTENILLYCDDILLHQKVYLSDIYFWFNDNRKTKNYTKEIKLILSTDNINMRDKVLLENLIK